MSQNSLVSYGPGNVFKPRRGILENFYTDDNIKKSLTMPQIRLFDYSLSEIDPANNKFTFLLICKDYYKQQGLTYNGGRNKSDLADDLEFFRTNNTPIMLLDDENDLYCKIHSSWFQDVEEYGRTSDGTVIGYYITVKQSIAMAMLQDPDQLVYPYIYAIRLKKKYGYFAWVYFHALNVFDQPVVLTLEELATHVGAKHKINTRWPDFRREVVEAMANDINNNAMDMEISWSAIEAVSEETGKKRVVAVELVVHRIIDPVNVHEICESDCLDFSKLDRIKQQISFDQLCEQLQDKTKAETAARIIYAAQNAVKQNDTSFAKKFGMTNDQMHTELNSLTIEHVRRGVEKAYKKKGRLGFIEIYILQCILDAKTNDAEPLLVAQPEITKEMPSIQNEPGIPVTIKRNSSDSHNVAKTVAKGTKKAEAMEYACKLISPESVRKLHLESRRGSSLLQSLGLEERLPVLSKTDLEMIELAINDFYATLAYVFSARCFEFQCGACKEGSHIVRGAENVQREKYKTMLVKSADIYFANTIISKYINNFDNLRNPDNEKSRINYLITMIWNEIWLREKEAHEC